MSNVSIRFRWFLASLPETKVTEVGISTTSANGGIIFQPPIIISAE